MTDILVANPVRLPDGSWGARVLGDIQPDSLVTIKTREGKTWAAIVTEIVEAPNPKNAYSLVRTKSAPKVQTPTATAAVGKPKANWGTPGFSTEKQAWEDVCSKATEGLVESIYLPAHGGGGTLLAAYDGRGYDRSTCTRLPNGVVVVSTMQCRRYYGTPEQVREAVEDFAKRMAITEEMAHKFLARFAGCSGWEGYRQILGIPDFLGPEECKQISQSWCENMGIVLGK